MKIEELFEIEYPKTLAYSWLVPDANGINFVSAQEKDNGIVGRVHEEDGVKVYPAGCITVPLKGSVLMAHLQPERCYVAHQIGVLIPKNEMSLTEKLFYVTCIRSHAYKYNYGRQADRTLGELEVPLAKDMMPELHCVPLSTRNEKTVIPINTSAWKWFRLGGDDGLFDIRKGQRLTSEDQTDGNTPYIGAIDSNNGVSNLIGQSPIHEGNTISLSYNGSVGEAFYQPLPYWATDDVNALYLRSEDGTLCPATGLFVCSVLKHDRYRYSYGRKWTLDNMNDTKIKLPATPDGKPDWQWMESYIKSLPYGDRL